MRPGDRSFVGNDAYAGGGTHLPDIVLAEPIFVDGHIVAWTVKPRASFGFRRIAAMPTSTKRACAIPVIRPLQGWRAAEGRARPHFAELPGAARAPSRNLRAPDGGKSCWRAALPGAVREIRHRGSCLGAGEALLDYAERKMRAGIAAIPGRHLSPR